MKRIFLYAMTALFLVLLLGRIGIRSETVYAEEAASPTPTYDPLKEPAVPEHPTDYELGHNWYWHYCMPCHGDKGQGLTDEWRSVWEADHQDCWGKGCHAGERIEDSFPIPTVVPAIVSNRKLAGFSSVQELCDFLETTHPPQNPGWLEAEQYHAIASYLFSENDRPHLDPTPAPTLTPPATLAQQPETVQTEEDSQKPNMIPYVGLGILLFGVLIWGFRSRR